MVNNFEVGIFQFTSTASQMTVNGCSILNCPLGIGARAQGTGAIDAVITGCKIDRASQEAIGLETATVTAIKCTLTHSAAGLASFDGGVG